MLILRVRKSNILCNSCNFHCVGLYFRAIPNGNWKKISIKLPRVRFGFNFSRRQMLSLLWWPVPEHASLNFQAQRQMSPAKPTTSGTQSLQRTPHDMWQKRSSTSSWFTGKVVMQLVMRTWAMQRLQIMAYILVSCLSWIWRETLIDCKVNYVQRQ